MGHWFEILIILALALLVFGPKRMIEMGSSLGKAFRELRDAAKEMDWSSLTRQNETTSTTSTTSSPPAGPRYKITPPPVPPVNAPPVPPEAQIVEGSLVDTPQAAPEPATASEATSNSPEAPSTQPASTESDSPETSATQHSAQITGIELPETTERPL
jgi:sec-independent protein translocase protein TatA